MIVFKNHNLRGKLLFFAFNAFHNSFFRQNKCLFYIIKFIIENIYKFNNNEILKAKNILNI